jgi:hypothetical protein
MELPDSILSLKRRQPVSILAQIIARVTATEVPAFLSDEPRSKANWRRGTRTAANRTSRSQWLDCVFYGIPNGWRSAAILSVCFGALMRYVLGSCLACTRSRSGSLLLWD